MKKILIASGRSAVSVDDINLKINEVSELADRLIDYDVTYIVSRNGVYPKNENMRILTVDTLDDYLKNIFLWAPEMDAIILGRDVFDDILHLVPETFNTLKKIAPKAKLFGFKTFWGVEKKVFNNWVRKTYDSVLDSKATSVLVIDMENPTVKQAITKEKSIIELDDSNYHNFIIDAIEDEYYQTENVDIDNLKVSIQQLESFEQYFHKYKSAFIRGDEQYLFGTIAIKGNRGFLTTGRGKNDIWNLSYVVNVSHSEKKVYVKKANNALSDKASLNAPLLAHIFETVDCDVIVHTHEENDGLPEIPYAFAGTVRDSIRDIKTSFYIKNHGRFYLFKDNKQL